MVTRILEEVVLQRAYMGSEVERTKGIPVAGDESDIKSLESDYRSLQQEAQSLLAERVRLENELSNVKKKASRLDEEVRILKSPPLIVGHLQDCLLYTSDAADDP